MASHLETHEIFVQFISVLHKCLTFICTNTLGKTIKLNEVNERIRAVA